MCFAKCYTVYMKKMTPKQALEKVRQLIILSNKEGADYDTFKKQAAPYLAIVNEGATKVAKEYGMRAKVITFSQIAR